MNEFLRDRIMRRLDGLPDERLYQVLDFVEFLESKYAQRQTPQNVFTRFAEGVEDTLRAGKVSTTAIAETMGLMNRAMGVLNGVAAAGRSVASDIVGAAQRAGQAGTNAANATSATSATNATNATNATSAGTASPTLPSSGSGATGGGTDGTTSTINGGGPTSGPSSGGDTSGGRGA